MRLNVLLTYEFVTIYRKYAYTDCVRYLIAGQRVVREKTVGTRTRMAKIFELIFPQEVTLLPSPALWLVFRSPLTHTQRQKG